MWKSALSVVFAVCAAVSCAPLTYTFPVEKRAPAVNGLDLEGCLVGIAALSGRDAADSLLMSALTVGVAEALESGLGLDSASVPVFSMYAEDIDMGDTVQADYILAYTGVDYLIVVDSLFVGEYGVSGTGEKSYIQGQFLVQTQVRLPYSVRLAVYSSAPARSVAEVRESDVLEWTLLSDNSISPLKAIGKVDGELDSYFRTIGGTMGSSLVPKWVTENKTLYVYDDPEWMEACRLAYVFEWEKAMDIWLEEAESPDMRKAACAAYNLSVACGILGMEEMASEWSARSEELFGRK